MELGKVLGCGEKSEECTEQPCLGEAGSTMLETGMMNGMFGMAM